MPLDHLIRKDSVSVWMKRNTALDVKRELLRHTLATLAYRGGKAISNAPDHFAAFRVHETTRTPAEILAHIGDLLDWALRTVTRRTRLQTFFSLAMGGGIRAILCSLEGTGLLSCFNAAAGLSGRKALSRTHRRRPDARRTDHTACGGWLERAFEAKTILRAEIEAGRVGADQSTKRMEFD